MGEFVDSTARLHASVVSSSALQQRVARDGDSFHITLINKHELSEFIRDGDKQTQKLVLLEKFQVLDAKDCTILGVGTAKRGVIHVDCKPTITSVLC